MYVCIYIYRFNSLYIYILLLLISQVGFSLRNPPGGQPALAYTSSAQLNGLFRVNPKKTKILRIVTQTKLTKYNLNEVRWF